MSHVQSHSGPGEAVLEYANNGTYPTAEDVVSASLGVGEVSSLLHGLGQARDRAKASIQNISKVAGPNVDNWIKQAKKLQSDIEEARETAREIVQQSNATSILRSQQQDLSSKAELLRSEIRFSKDLGRKLEDIQAVSDQLNKAQSLVDASQIVQALALLTQAEQTLTTINDIAATTPVRILHQRCDRLKSLLAIQVGSLWSDIFKVDNANMRLHILDRSSSGLDIATVISMSTKLQLLDHFVEEACQSLNQSILIPRLSGSAYERGARFNVASGVLSVITQDSKRGPFGLIEDLTQLIDFLDQLLPQAVALAIVDGIMPSTISRLMTSCLSSAIPTSLEGLADFKDLLGRVKDFASYLSSKGHIGSTELDEWADSAPRLWLAKQRESSLNAVRLLLSRQLSETRVVERVETQTVSRKDLLVGGDGKNEDDWNEHWADDDENATHHKNDKAIDAEADEDASAWDVNDDAEPKSRTHETHIHSITNGRSEPRTDDVAEAEEEAWGWDDQNDAGQPDSPTKFSNESHSAMRNGKDAPSEEQEITLREVYTISGMPGKLVELIRRLGEDAKSLETPPYSRSPVAPAVAGLFSIPTLMLAGFRALAPMNYGATAGGNMLLYNDGMRLVDELQALSLEKNSYTARLKIDLELDALTSFSRRAYGKEMESQRLIIRDLLDGAQGFTNCTESPFAAECESAVSMTVDRIREMAKKWNGILSRSALLQSLGSLLSTVVGKIVVDIEDLGDIGDEESKKLRGIFNRISKLSDLFQQDGETDVTKDMTGVYTPDWWKFQYLSDILDSSLADIMHMWTEEDLRLEFEAVEVADLIEALFAESDYRRRAIAEIKAAV